MTRHLLAALAAVVALSACSSPSTVPASAAPASPSPEVVVPTPAAALAAYSLTVVPSNGEGLISLVRRNCPAADWQTVAAANGVTAPSYWLGERQRIRIDCPGPAAVGTGAPSPSPGAPTSAVTTVVPASPAWVHPTDPGDCLVPNGSREFGTNRGTHRHGGVDLGPVSGVYRGDPVRAIHAGVAHHGYQGSGAGIYVWVDHGNGSTSWYFHLGSRAVGDGARVTAGQVIGYVGSSGNATSPHLHLEVKVNGSRVDPVRYLADRSVRIGC